VARREVEVEVNGKKEKKRTGPFYCVTCDRDHTDDDGPAEVVQSSPLSSGEPAQPSESDENTSSS
jgi:hypothetical protein